MVFVKTFQTDYKSGIRKQKSTDHIAMGSYLGNRGGTCPAMVIDHHEHLQSYAAKKQVSFDVKAAQQRVGNAVQPDCQPSSSSKNPIPIGEDSVREMQQMEKMHDSVLDAIHAALSKESLIKKLVLPFNETLNSATKKAGSSRWEWQKNTALLELENRNQHLQHLLSQAGRDAMELESRAQEDRKLLEQTLQRNKEEAMLLAKARDIRARLVEQMQIMARSKHLKSTLSAWHHFCRKARKKRALRRAERMWRARTLLKSFTAFMAGCDRSKQTLNLNQYAAQHRSRNLLLSTIRVWWRGALLRRDAKDKFHGFTTFWARYRLRLVMVHWQNHCVQVRSEVLIRKKAIRFLYFSFLRRAWRGWIFHTASAHEKKLNAELFVFLRIARECLQNWHGLIVRKKQRARQLEMGGQQRQTYLLRASLQTWCRRTRRMAVMMTRLEWYIKRKAMRTKWVVIMKWWHHTVRVQQAHRRQAQLVTKIERRCKDWAFQAVKKCVTNKTLLEAHKVQRSNKLRETVVRSWLHEVRAKQARRLWMHRLLRQFRHRMLQKLFSSWLVYTELCRRQSAEQNSQDVEAKMKALETDLVGAAEVKADMERRLAGYEAERLHIVKESGAAIARTPAWTSGFLDAELRWRSPVMDDKWLPPAQAGHSTVTLPLKTNRTSCSVIFGGYNGQECFNDVIVFDCEDAEFHIPPTSVAPGSVFPPPMRNHSTCAFGDNKMILFGGFDGSYEFSDLSLLTFSEGGNSCEWSQPEKQKNAVPASFSHHTACVTEDANYMVVFGGYRSCVGHLNETWLLDLHTMTWTSPDYFGIPPSPRRGHSAVIIDKRMYVFGGYNGSAHLSDLQVLHLASMTWKSIKTLGESYPSARRQHAMTAVGRHLVVYGGYNGETYLDDMHVFDTESCVWKRWPIMKDLCAGSSMDQRVFGRSMHTMVALDHRLVIFGGVHELGALNDLLFLENAAAVGGLQLQTCLFEETAKVHNLRADIVACKQALQEKSTELVVAHSKLVQVHSALKVEAEKRKIAVEGQRVLVTKLQKARGDTKSLMQTCRRLQEEQKILQRLVVEFEQHQASNRQKSLW